MSHQLHLIYIREMPQTEALEAFSNKELEHFNKTLQEELTLIQEETVAMTNYAQVRREAEAEAAKAAAATAGTSDAAVFGAAASSDVAGGGGGGISGDGAFGGDEAIGGGIMGGAGGAGGSGATATTGKRRGNRYRRKSSETKQLVLNVEDKMTVIIEEHDRVKSMTQAAKEQAIEARETLNATIVEAETRAAELKLAETYFKRDVVDGDPATAMERLQSWIADRPNSYAKQLKKLEEKSVMIQQQLAKLQSQLDSTGEAGDKFIRIDFDQLTIEKQQYEERLADKDKELKKLKRTTTRTVQTLNSLTDRLQQLLEDQNESARNLDSRRNHSTKLERELDDVRKGCSGARNKNTSLKIQHESVKVPKVEEYIAQKAEEYELKKAVSNWRRKVEIARGHVHVMKQKSRETKRQTRAAAEARSALLQTGGSSNVRQTFSGLRGGGGGSSASPASFAPSVTSAAAAASAAGGPTTSSSSGNNNAISSPGGANTSGLEAIPVPPPAAVSSGISSQRRK